MSEHGVNIETASRKTIPAGHPPIELPCTIVSGQNLVAGTVLGKITASGKYQGYDDDAATGIEVAAAILRNDVDASAADANGVMYVHGDFNLSDLTWVDAVNDIPDGTADLYAVGIFLK